MIGLIQSCNHPASATCRQLIINSSLTALSPQAVGSRKFDAKTNKQTNKYNTVFTGQSCGFVHLVQHYR